MLPDKNSYDQLGGEKIDYQPVEDPNTDLSAEASNEMRADVAAMTRMLPRAYVSFTVTAGVPTVVDHDAVWGNALGVKPTVTYGSAGIYTVAFPATVTDARGVTRAVNLRCGWGNCSSVITGYVVNVVRDTPTLMVVSVTNLDSPRAGSINI